MTIADSRVVGQLTVRTGPFITITDFDYCGGLADGIYQIVPETLLAEAEATIREQFSQISALEMCAQAMQADNEALQSRLDAVVVVAADLEESSKYGGYNYEARNLCQETADELRAALGGESPANDEELK